MHGGRLEIPPRGQVPGPDTASFSGLDEYIGLLKRCWAQAPEDRPSFDEIVPELRWVMMGGWVVGWVGGSLSKAEPPGGRRRYAAAVAVCVFAAH